MLVTPALPPTYKRCTPCQTYTLLNNSLPNCSAMILLLLRRWYRCANQAHERPDTTVQEGCFWPPFPGRAAQSECFSGMLLLCCCAQSPCSCSLLKRCCCLCHRWMVLGMCQQLQTCTSGVLRCCPWPSHCSPQVEYWTPDSTLSPLNMCLHVLVLVCRRKQQAMQHDVFNTPTAHTLQCLQVCRQRQSTP